MALAAEVAKSSDYKQRHGAVLYKRGHIISIGYNRKKTHPVAARYYEFGYTHAELDCLLKTSETDLTGMTLACVRLNKSGKIMHSRPCEGCIRAMQTYGITCMVYSSRTGIEKENI